MDDFGAPMQEPYHVPNGKPRDRVGEGGDCLTEGVGKFFFSRLQEQEEKFLGAAAGHQERDSL